MKTSELNEWLAVVVNIGVIIGLAAVVYEIRQTNIALDRESRQWTTEISFSTNEMFQNVAGLIIENSELWTRAAAGEELNDSDTTRFREIADQMIWANFQQYRVLDERGFPGEYAIQNLMSRLAKNPGLITHFENWALRSRGSTVTEFIDKVDDALKEG